MRNKIYPLACLAAILLTFLSACAPHNSVAVLQSGLAAIPVSPYPPVTYNEKNEMRAGWVVSWRVMTSPAAIDKLLAIARNSNLNTLFVQVRTAGDAYYSSSLVPRSESLKNDGFDPLAYMLEKGHAQGFKIHAWMNMGIVWRTVSPPVDPNHIFNRHPDWVAKDAKGKMAFPDIYDSGPGVIEDFYWVDWGNPELRAHLIDVVQEVANRYPVDGIHLDFLRYPARMGPMTQGIGYNITTIDRFRQEMQASPLESSRLWDQWRTAQIASTVKGVHEMLGKSPKKIPLSAAVLSAWDLAYGRCFTDFRKMLETGYLDFAVLMSYSANPDYVWKSVINATETVDAKRIIVGLGLYIKENSPEKTAEQIQISRELNTGGFALFSLDTESIPNLESYMAQLRHLAIHDTADDRYSLRDPVWSRIGVIDSGHSSWNFKFFSRNGKTKIVIYQRGLDSLQLAVNGTELPLITFKNREYIQLDISPYLLPFSREVADNHDFKLSASAGGKNGRAEIFAVDYYASE